MLGMKIVDLKETSLPKDWEVAEGIGRGSQTRKNLRKEKLKREQNEIKNTIKYKTFYYHLIEKPMSMGQV